MRENVQGTIGSDDQSVEERLFIGNGGWKEYIIYCIKGLKINKAVITYGGFDTKWHPKKKC